MGVTERDREKEEESVRGGGESHETLTYRDLYIFITFIRRHC